MNIKETLHALFLVINVITVKNGLYCVSQQMLKIKTGKTSSSEVVTVLIPPL